MRDLSVGKYVSVRGVRLTGKVLSDYIEDRKMGLWYEQFCVMAKRMHIWKN